MTMSMTLGLEWGLDKMMTLAELSVHDFDMLEESLEDIDFEYVELLLDLWVDSTSKRNYRPSWIICLRIWPTGLLSKIVESVHLFHLRKYCHQWTILCLVYGTSTDITTLNWKCVCSINRFSYTQSIQSFDNGIHLLGQL